MAKTKYITDHVKSKQLRLAQRTLIEDWQKEPKATRLSQNQFAKKLHCSSSTLANELKRGREPYLSKKGKTKYHRYSAAYAEEKYKAKRLNQHKTSFLHKHPAFKARLLELLTPKPGVKRKSVGVALFMLREEFDELPCERTIYYDVYHGLFPELLDILTRYKKHEKFITPDYKKHLGMPITERPDAVNERKEFGHWEIDLVIGTRAKGEVLLTILERTTNFYIVRRCANKEAETINREVRDIMKSYGKKNFKTITSDNGSEFSNLHKLRGVSVYFCHPFCSWEKGANERHNRMLREFIPKGKRIEDFTPFQVISAMTQINEYPRRSKKFKTPRELFDAKTA
jgi:IS30 family transposase